jgi:hypothetical protein
VTYMFTTRRTRRYDHLSYNQQSKQKAELFYQSTQARSRTFLNYEVFLTNIHDFYSQALL